ncbi:MAG: transporter substrate-binding domain-containing protein [Oscillospiraceae bacterium]|nr:transporter substrate-binding domain-containing protein [Oscillospiraceae bacterium]
MKLTKILALALVACLAVTMLVGCSSEKVATTFVVLDETLDAEEYGIGFRKADVAFGMAVQAALDEMIADGTAAEISKKWFSEDILLKGNDYIGDTTVADDDKSLEYIKEKGTMVLGLDDSFPPMGFRDENNNIVGFDIDLATEVAKRLGVTLELQPIDWDSKEMELEGKKIDMIWNGMTITPERAEAMFFGKAYIANKQVVIVPEGSKIKTLAYLKDKVVGLQKGSSSLDALNKNEAVASSVKQIAEYPDNVTAFMDLKAGRIDAFVVDEVAGRYIISTNK